MKKVIAYGILISVSSTVTGALIYGVYQKDLFCAVVLTFMSIVVVGASVMWAIDEISRDE